MQSATRLAPSTRARRSDGPTLAAAGRAFAGLGWLAIAAGAAWLVFATPLLERLLRLDSSSASTPVLGAAVLAAALVAPAAFGILGIARVAGAIAQARAAASRTPPVARMASRLPDGCRVIPSITLPDGHRVSDVVVGPHGIAIFRTLPPLAAVRRTSGRWEVRFSDRSWRPIESPLVRAARDAEGLRRHLEALDAGFVVRVQAAVLGDPTAVERAEGCAVVRGDDVPAWLAALPAQRGLTPDRLAEVLQLLEPLT